MASGDHRAQPPEWTAADAARILRVPTDASHKYSRGVAGLRTGSVSYPGAAVLSVEGAARAGAGMVRWLGPVEVARLVLQRRPEVVTTPGRVDAWVIGSGTDPGNREPGETLRLREILAGSHPVVVDAGALDVLDGASAPFVATPHAGEFARLRERLGLPQASGEAGAAAAVRETAAALGGVVLLKGSETIVAAPSGWATVVRSGTPWLATAGTGDVLAGALGALAAAAAAEGPAGVGVEQLAPLAATAAWVHGVAGRLAAGIAATGIPAAGSSAAAGPAGGGPVAAGPTGGGRPITALDVAERLPEAWAIAFAERA
ncbi:ADP-dependent NAD(P)H-hydrate dehydratase [Microbacterium album]|nr:ADP/ATP-dependent (S)-NAD(P)H-hydrate dehydratase [Microbacterium album]